MTWYGNDFLHKASKTQFMKEITDKPDFIKIKYLHSAKDNDKRTKQ